MVLSIEPVLAGIIALSFTNSMDSCAFTSMKKSMQNRKYINLDFNKTNIYVTSCKCINYI